MISETNGKLLKWKHIGYEMDEKGHEFELLD